MPWNTLPSSRANIAGLLNAGLFKTRSSHAGGSLRAQAQQFLHSSTTLVIKTIVVKAFVIKALVINALVIKTRAVKKRDEADKKNRFHPACCSMPFRAAWL